MHKSGLGAIAAICLTGCAATITATENAPAPKALEHSEDIGATRWIKKPGSIQFCDSPYLAAKCQHRDTGKFIVDGIERPGFTLFVRVRFDDGELGYVPELDYLIGTSTTDPAVAAAECKRRGDPRIGMTAAQVAATCWGKPENVNRTIVAGSTEDQYVYAGGRYVYLRNGVVNAIQASGSLR